MKKQLRKLQLQDTMQLGPTATSSIDVFDPNEHRRRQFAGTTLELDDTTGLVTINFRGKELFVHMSACRYAEGYNEPERPANVTVTKYDPKAVEAEPDEVPSLYIPDYSAASPAADSALVEIKPSSAPAKPPEELPPFKPGPFASAPVGDPDEFDDPPPTATIGKKRGRPPKKP